MTENLNPPVTHRPAPYHSPSRIRAWLIGRPLPTADAPHQAIRKRVALAVFASDALSSTAYATQEILLILAAAGTAAFGFTFPIALAIVSLLAIVTLSYQQTIHAYPGGGGAYIVSRENLGNLPAQIAGAALLTDYILTVAVSVSAGVAQLASAYPDLFPLRVPLAVILVLAIMLINLRGVKESGTIFAIPTYFFLAMMALTILTGLVRLAAGELPMVTSPPEMEAHVLQPLTLFLVLRAFSSGTTALTGVEAISNGISAFRAPRSRNAAVTLVWMAAILGVLFLGITFLALEIGALPSEAETVVSQLARTVYAGRGSLYLMAISATTLILVMAANTAFADFPRLSALMAGDRYLPRQFMYRGSRLVFTWGIVVLAMAASLLIVVFQASVSGLIPLYAIGVFLSFTLSQTGMARRWHKIGRLDPQEPPPVKDELLRFDPGWRWKMLLNGFGAVCTAVVMLIFAVTKFREGAWVVLIIIPAGVVVLYSVHRHFVRLAERLSLENFGPPTALKIKEVILPISGVHRGTLAALRYAQSLGSAVTAVHVAVDEDDSQKVGAKWTNWGASVPLVMIDSPYRELMHPLVAYIHEAAAQCAPAEVITVVVPQFVPEKSWHNLLHMQTAAWLRWALLHEQNVVVVDVAYQVP
jgi:amino acid transporter